MDTYELNSGIYRLDFASGHFYIGQSVNVIRRWRLHKSTFKHGSMQKHHPKLFNVWAKYGNPTFKILIYCEIDEMTHVEQQLITKYWGNQFLTNTNPDAQTSRGVKRAHTPWQLGRIFTQEHRRKLSEARQHMVGIYNPTHRFTEEEIREIRNKYVPIINGSVKLGKEYGVSHRTILYIVNRQRYANVI